VSKRPVFLCHNLYEIIVRKVADSTDIFTEARHTICCNMIHLRVVDRKSESESIVSCFPPEG